MQTRGSHTYRVLVFVSVVGSVVVSLCLVWGCAGSGHRLVHVGIHVAEMAPNAAPWVGVFGSLCCRLFAQ